MRFFWYFLISYDPESWNFLLIAQAESIVLLFFFLIYDIRLLFLRIIYIFYILVLHPPEFNYFLRVIEVLQQSVGFLQQVIITNAIWRYLLVSSYTRGFCILSSMLKTDSIKFLHIGYCLYFLYSSGSLEKEK